MSKGAGGRAGVQGQRGGRLEDGAFTKEYALHHKRCVETTT